MSDDDLTEGEKNKKPFDPFVLAALQKWARHPSSSRTWIESGLTIENAGSCPPRHKIQMKYARQRGKWCKEADPDDPLVWTRVENSEATGGSLKEKWDDQRIGEAFCDTIVSYNFLTQLSGTSF